MTDQIDLGIRFPWAPGMIWLIEGPAARAAVNNNRSYIEALNCVREFIHYIRRARTYL